MDKICQLANKEFNRIKAPLIYGNSNSTYEIVRPGVIQGNWNEDGNTFEIHCPIQLQDNLLSILLNLENLEIRSK